MLLKTLFIILFTTILIGCATDHTQSINSKDSYPMYADEAANRNLHSIAASILENDPESANEKLNQILGYAPCDPWANLLNGMAYQARAAGEGPLWDMAKIGYRLAKKFDPYLWQAPYMLGLMLLKERNPTAASIAFSEAAFANPFNSAPLYALATASYAQGDLSTAYQATKQALLIDGNNHINPLPRAHHIAALCAASVGEFAEASAHVATLKAHTLLTETNWLEQKIRDWQLFYATSANQPLTSDHASQPVSEASTPPNANKSRMAIIDVIILRTSAANTQSRGINLLEGLSAQFEGVLVNPIRTRTNDLLNSKIISDQEISTNSLKLSIPAVTYTLNIANNANSTSKIVGNPSVLALDGKESKFFLGNELTIFTTGDYVNTAVKEYGLSIQVTPTFLSDDMAELHVESGLSILNAGKPPGVDKNSLALEKANNNVSAVMRFGETLVVSAGAIYQEDHQQTGVPLIDKIPIINKLFSHSYSEILQGSLLILLTLKPSPHYGIPVSSTELLKQNPTFVKIQKRFEPVSLSVQARLDSIKNGDVFTVIHPSDMTPSNPIYAEGADEPSQQWRQQFLHELVTGSN